jgi:hypothetical protein
MVDLWRSIPGFVRIETDEGILRRYTAVLVDKFVPREEGRNTHVRVVNCKRAGLICMRPVSLDCHPESNPIVRRMNQILLSAKVSLCRLNRCVAQKQLDLLKLATGGAAHLRATAP